MDLSDTMFHVRVRCGTHIDSGPKYPKTHAVLLLGSSATGGRINQLESKRVRYTSESRHSRCENESACISLRALFLDSLSAGSRVLGVSDDAARDGSHEFRVSLLLLSEVVQ